CQKALEAECANTRRLPDNQIRLLNVHAQSRPNGKGRERLHDADQQAVVVVQVRGLEIRVAHKRVDQESLCYRRLQVRIHLKGGDSQFLNVPGDLGDLRFVEDCQVDREVLIVVRRIGRDMRQERLQV